MNFENVMIKSESIDIEEEYGNVVEAILDSKNKEKLFKCGICGHHTTSNILLNLHMKMHLLKRIHQCNVCRRSFNFVTELNAHMLNHKNLGKDEGNVSNLNLSPHSNGDITKSGQVKNDGTNKKFKNNPNLPMSTQEKEILLQYVEEMQLNTKYIEMESMKSYLRKSWIKMSELFAEKEYDRSPEKLARTYIHMKNQAKLHVDRFYKQKKLPRPRKVDYLFVKLCPADFEALGLDVQEIIEDFRIFESGNDSPIRNEVISQMSEDDIPNEDAPDLISSEDIQEVLMKPGLSVSEELVPTEDFEIPAKIRKLDSDTEPFSKDVKEMEIKFLLAEEQRRKHLYSIEIAQREELFSMELRHKKEIHEKEMEMKNLELILLKQKSQKNDCL